MSLLNTVNPGAAQQAPTTAAPPPWQQPPPIAQAPAAQPAPVATGWAPVAAPPPIAQQAAPPAQLPQVTLGLPDAGAAMRAQLEAEEGRARAVQAAQPIPGFREACEYVHASGRGFPALAGRAAAMYAVLIGHPPVSQNPQFPVAYQGQGDLAKITGVTEPEHLFKIATELSELAAQQAAAAPAVIHVQHAQAPAAILPPEAPASNPALAARPVDAPAAQSGPPPLPPPPATGKGSRGPRKPKAPPTAAVPGAMPVAAEAPTVGGDLEVFVDCIPNGEYESLHPYIDSLCRALEQAYCTSGIADIRCAPEKGPLGYGGWRGGIHAAVRTSPPPDASYYVDTRGNDIAAEVADALRSVCEARGALYVRGVR